MGIDRLLKKNGAYFFIHFLSPQEAGSRSNTVPRWEWGEDIGPMTHQVTQGGVCSTRSSLIPASVTSLWICFLCDETRSYSSHIILFSLCFKKLAEYLWKWPFFNCCQFSSNVTASNWHFNPLVPKPTFMFSWSCLISKVLSFKMFLSFWKDWIYEMDTGQFYTLLYISLFNAIGTFKYHFS